MPSLSQLDFHNRSIDFYNLVSLHPRIQDGISGGATKTGLCPLVMSDNYGTFVGGANNQIFPRSVAHRKRWEPLQ